MITVKSWWWEVIWRHLSEVGLRICCVHTEWQFGLTVVSAAQSQSEMIAGRSTPVWWLYGKWSVIAVEKHPTGHRATKSCSIHKHEEKKKEFINAPEYLQNTSQPLWHISDVDDTTLSRPGRREREKMCLLWELHSGHILSQGVKGPPLFPLTFGGAQKHKTYFPIIL